MIDNTNQENIIIKDTKKKISEAVIKASNMREYTKKAMKNDIESFRKGAWVKTGYDNLDDKTSLYPGLYVLGAGSSIGKTTFAYQMADQLAEAGEKVVYFSMEQSTLELATKSLSRSMAKLNPDTALTSLQIRKIENDIVLGEALDMYNEYSENITVVECSFECTIKDIERYVNEYIRDCDIKPIVMIDYLQIIKNEDRRLTTKDVVDSNVQRLKQLQEENDIVVIVISSLNRQNYLTQIDFESFKESGGIEYTADVVWGLQLEVIYDELFNTSKINEKREKYREAKADNPRKIELICLKNRFGPSSYHCQFDYYCAYDYFVPEADSSGSDMVDASSMPDKDGFRRADPEQCKMFI